jgi:hypothetical protein
MSQIRNVALGLLALVVSSASWAGNLSGNFDATYLGPLNQSIASGAAAALDCTAATNCSFTRPPSVPDGQSRVAIILASNVDGLSVHVDLGLWAMEACRPDPTTPDFTGTGDLVLGPAGGYIISFQTEDLLPAGTTYSQKWNLSTTDLSVVCGLSYCVNSISGQPQPAPMDCDAM